MVDELDDERYETFVDPVDGSVWHVDVGFTDSKWRCLWGRGCEGILDVPAAALDQGCCSVGARMLDAEEARRIGALGLSLDPARFQHHAEARRSGVLAGDDRAATRVVDGACIFLNRVGYPGGAGCALHLAAEDEGEATIDWKPAVCWQLPLKVEERLDGGRVLRRWRRSDWGAGGDTMAWCCTEEPAAGLPSAFVGDRSVAESLQQEIEALVGPEVAVELRRRSSPPD